MRPFKALTAFSGWIGGGRFGTKVDRSRSNRDRRSRAALEIMSVNVKAVEAAWELRHGQHLAGVELLARPEHDGPTGVAHGRDVFNRRQV